jgi:hypothetical protein
MTTAKKVANGPRVALANFAASILVTSTPLYELITPTYELSASNPQLTTHMTVATPAPNVLKRSFW